MSHDKHNTAAGSTAAIELTDLSRRFGQTWAVNGLSLKIPRGSTFGLIGPNGAGKSTTIRMLMGMLRPTMGRATVLGLDALAEPVALRQRVGYVPETHNVYRWMRVYQVIGFCQNAYSSWNEETCSEMLQLFGLDPRKKVKHLSKGMLVKLSLLIAVSHEPELLVLDEPMAGLDPIAREEFLDGVLRTICERGQTVLFSTHSLDDVQRLADTVGILYEGRLLVHQGVEALLTETKRIRAVLRDSAMPEQPPKGTVWQRVEGREWLLTVEDFSPEKVQRLREQNAVDHVEVIDVGLEDIFKDFVKGRRAAS
ncbi:MAG: ABC transporter ATP-binding protein [Pirellulaceae bacterium]|nr:ABC transporter ATP-binding protein [Pirellulaceae bacterium]